MLRGVAGGSSSGSSSPTALTLNNQTSAYTIVAGDLGKLVNCTTGTFTLALTAAATLTAGFYCWVVNSGTSNAVTIDPNGTEKVNGLTTFILRPNQNGLLICDGANFQFLGSKPMLYDDRQFPGSTGIPSATANGCVALGGNAAASGPGDAIAVGASATSSGNGSAAFGKNTTASGNNSTASGYGSTASAGQSMATGYNSLSAIIGKRSYAGNLFAAAGDGQEGLHILMAATTDGTATRLTTDAAAAGSTNQVILANSAAFAFDGIVVARQQGSGGTASAAWKIEGLIRRDANAAATTLVANTVTAISNVPGWTLALAADTTNGGLAATFTGAAATNIRTVATIRTAETTYA